jgi:hypothetical protein
VTEYSCDYPDCKVMLLLLQREYEGVPEGWGYHSVPGCGVTNYTRLDLYCPTHMQAQREKQQAAAKVPLQR